MAPKRKGRRVVGTVRKTKKVVKETVEISMVETGTTNKDDTPRAVGDSQETVEELDSLSPPYGIPTEEHIKRTIVVEDTQEPEKEESTPEKKKKNKVKRRWKEAEEGNGEYKRYVLRVLKLVHPGMKVSSQAMEILNAYMNDMFGRLADEAAKLSRYTKKMTLSSREIQGAVKLVLPGDLGKHAVAEGAKAITNYMDYGGNGGTGK